MYILYLAPSSALVIYVVYTQDTRGQFLKEIHVSLHESGLSSKTDQ